MKDKEQRGIKRYSIDGLSVIVQRTGLMGFFGKSKRKHLVLDISEGGIHFISKSKFTMGQKLSLVITAHILKEQTIEAQGKIKRMKELPGLDTYGVGAEFTDIDSDNRTKLAFLIKSIAKAKGDTSSLTENTIGK